MSIVPGALAFAAGLFLFLWYRTVAGLPKRRRPFFTRRTDFKWGMPILSAALFVSGLLLLVSVSIFACIAAIALATLVAGLIIKFDRYSAGMRIMYDDYILLSRSNPGMSEPDALFYTARRRYPGWSEDRLVELVAGKDIQNLILLVAIGEHGVDPITDWELYQSMRAKAARIAAPRKVRST